MTIKFPGHLPGMATICRQWCPSNVQDMHRKIKLYLSNNVRQMFRACTWQYYYIYAIIFVKCPGHVTDITAAFWQCSSNFHGMYLTLQQYLDNNVHQMSRACNWHYHYIYAILTIKCAWYVLGMTTILRQ